MASRVEIQYNYTSLMINFIKGNVQVGAAGHGEAGPFRRNKTVKTSKHTKFVT